MTTIEVTGVSHRYGRVKALSEVDLRVADGSVYALLGPNGAGKTTLLRIVLGLLRPTSGRVTVLAQDVKRLTVPERARIGYVAEGQRLPGWMTVRRVENYLAPLYPSWDAGLADELRERFRLPADRRIRHLSRGERMKVSMLCALAPRPRLVVMDEPFTGMDALVKDELVRGLLELVGEGGWSVLVSSHDIGELETLADAVGILNEGRLVVSEPMDTLRERFRWVEVVGENGGLRVPPDLDATALSVDRAGPRMSFLLSSAPDRAVEVEDWFRAASRVTVRPATLREIFVGVARQASSQPSREEAP